MQNITENIYVGDIEDADPEPLKQNNITHIINLSGKPAEYSTLKNKNYIHIPLKDGEADPDMFQLAATAAHNMQQRAQQNQGNILIHCAAGQSRSIAVTATLLKTIKTNQDYNDALNTIKEKRPIANPHPALNELGHKTNLNN